jgi:hypothetical protein
MEINMAWIILGIIVLLMSGLIGVHLARFRDAYTEMTGMMAGMTMGMLNGFLLGYAAAGLFNSMFWGNLFGITLGSAIGCYFGRAGGLMGVMDGGMGGVMGGSMGAMLLVMLVWPQYIAWTAGLLSIVYLAGMAGLVALVEKSAPDQVAHHLLLPIFTRVAAADQPRLQAASTRRPAVDDYYTFLGVGRDATGEQITAAYLEQLSIADEEIIARAERAYSTLTVPNRRRAYDARLSESIARGDCCPPPRRERVAGQAATAAVAVAATAQAEPDITRRPMARVVTPSSRPLSKNDPASQPIGGQATPARLTSRYAPEQDAPQKQSAGRQSADGRRSMSGTQTMIGRPPKEPPISWVGVVAALVIATTLIIWWLSAQGHAASPAPALSAAADSGSALSPAVVQRLESQAVVVPITADGRQTVDFVVNGTTRSYKPSVLKVKQGVPVHFNITVEGADPGCGRYVGIKALDVHAVASPGETVQMDFTPAQTGIFQINCNMQMMGPGYLIVTQ